MSAEDDYAIARSIDSAAHEVKLKFYQRGAAISDGDYTRLQNEFLSLQNMAMRIRTLAVSELLAESTTSVASLKRVTASAATTIKKVADIKKVILISTALFTLAAAIAASVAAPNPITIVAAYNALNTAINAANA